jgi:hypothetical protein
MEPEAPAMQAASVTGPTTRLRQDHPVMYIMPAAPTSISLSEAAPLPPAAPVPPAAPQLVTPSLLNALPHNNGIFGAIFLIGLGLLFLTDGIFPGILLVVGITSFLRESAQGRPHRALNTLIFFAGLTMLFWFDAIFPGILFLLGLMALLNARRGFQW